MSSSEIRMMRCVACRAKNRIPVEKIGLSATCGKCRSPLDTGVLNIDYPVTVTDSSFEREVLGSPLPVLLDCWAAWCAPCQMISATLFDLAAQWRGRIRVAKLNVEQNPQTATRFQVLSLPTLLIFDGGRLMDTLAGALPKQSIVSAMSPYL